MKLTLLSKYRTPIMGAAMMWIMFLHTIYYGSSPVIDLFHKMGIYGVDMFLLVSGMGIYYSMRKSRSAGEFYKKRAIRILPVYFLLSISWYVFFKTDVSLGDKLLSIFGINYFRGTVYKIQEFFDWFIPFITVLYLLTPLYDKLFQKAAVKWKLTCLVAMISPALGVLAHFTHRQVLYFSITRIPIYLIGYCVGYFLYEKKEEKKDSWMVYLSMLFVGVLIVYLLQYYFNTYDVKWGSRAYNGVLLAPPICMFFALLCMYVEKLKIVGKILLFPFKICGRYSLEIYLLHQRLIEIVNSDKLASLKQNFVSRIGGRGFYFLVAIFTIVAAGLIHELIAFVIRLFRDAGNKKDNAPAKIQYK